MAMKATQNKKKESTPRVTKLLLDLFHLWRADPVFALYLKVELVDTWDHALQ